MVRIDSYPTHEINGFKVRIGRTIPFGATIVPGGINFSVFSRHATGCVLVLFKKGEKEPWGEVPFPDEFRIGNVFSIIVFDIDIENTEYGYRMEGEYNPRKGHWFNRDKILLDPYAKSISGRSVWGTEPDWSDVFWHRGRIVPDDFDWEGDKPLELPMETLIVYELHVRSFTKHESSGVKYAGTYAGMLDKIPYLKELGINCVELLPIFEFDEFENSRKLPTGETLYNYWGYSTVGFFAPKVGYAATGALGMENDELKNLVKTLHKNGIEVILDVVFNHTAEGNENGPYISFRGIDNKTYYLLTPDGWYYNFSGCGNTVNCNNPVVRSVIVDCLRYWAAEYHVDGFRFDLASILSRGEDGAPIASPPLLESLAHDMVLAKCKLIAEAWDAGGLYQVGAFPFGVRWAEWNGKYRDAARKFLKGDGSAAEMRVRMEGSWDLYAGRTSNASVNFITCHDGFTLMDMVSYNDKHNELNGEDNRDGGNDNHSWNCGHEGDGEPEAVRRLRRKQIKNAVSILLMSRGVPMLLAGDEFGNSQNGNNNAYCHDNEISWLNWDGLRANNDIFNYFKKIIAFRKKHPVLGATTYDSAPTENGYPEISWHSHKTWNIEHSDCLSMAMMYVECDGKYHTGEDNFIYIAINMYWEPQFFQLPILPAGKSWRVIFDTDAEAGNDTFDDEKAIPLTNQQELFINERSVTILIGK